MLHLLKHRSFFLIWAGQTASGLGGTFITFIQGWLLYQLTGSKLAMGSLWMIVMLTSIFVQIWSGPFLDRWDLRTVMILSQWGRGFIYLLPAGMFFGNSLEVWHLYLAAVVTGIAEPLYRPAGMAYIASLLKRDQLVKGNSLLEGTMQLTMLIGPVAGGFAVYHWGAGIVFILLIGLLAASGLLLFQLPQSSAKTSQKKRSWYGELKEGFRFFRRYPLFFWIGLIMAIVNFSAGAFLPMVIPFVTEILHGTSLEVGLYQAGFPLGYMLGSMYTGGRKHPPRDRRKWMLSALLLQGLFASLLGWIRLFPVALFMEIAIGFCASLFTIQNTTLYQQYVPSEIRGRVFTLRMLMARLGFPIGAFFSGAVAEILSLPILFSIIGALILLTGSIAWFSPVYFHLNNPLAPSTHLPGNEK